MFFFVWCYRPIASSPAPARAAQTPLNRYERRGWSLREKGKKQKLFLVLSPRPGPHGPNASGWYKRLREPISPLLLLNCDQLWQLFSCGWTILLSTVIYDLYSRIAAKYQNVRPLSTQSRSLSVFTLWDHWDTCISEYLHKDSNLEVSWNRGSFE